MKCDLLINTQVSDDKRHFHRLIMIKGSNIVENNLLKSREYKNILKNKNLVRLGGSAG